MLGEGKYGTAYKYKEKVYKINCAKLSDRDKILSAPSRIARIWNDVYSTIYGGQFHHFASAKMILLDGECILETPYIEGEHIVGYEQALQFNQCFFRTHHRVIGDGRVVGNLKLHKGYILPVDFDHVFDIRRNSFGSEIISKIYNFNDLIYS